MGDPNDMPGGNRGAAAVLLAIFIIAAAPAFAQPADELASETRHTITLDGQPFAYIARTGTLTVPAEEDKPEGERGRIFYVAYERSTPAPGPRPLTFVFNGGPGAAAAYLHLGLMGPRRLDFEEMGQVPERPEVVDNAQTWLRFTDLVFVDPVGTGFSRALPAGKGGDDEKGGNRGGGGDGRSAFFATEKDLDSLSAFIRLYLTRHQRWLSPKVLAGESYGGFRVAALADRLQARFGVSVGGLVMVSPALELGLMSENRFRLLPWITRLPSYAAAARHHGRAAPASDPQRPQWLPEFEAFVTAELLPAMAAGAGGHEALLRRLADHIGLPPDVVIRHGAKIPAEEFAARLLEDEGRLVSLYDASITEPAPHPAASRARDSRLARISAAVTAAFNDEIRTRLGVTTDLTYHVLNRRVGAQWSWENGDWGGGPGAAENLERAMKTVPGMGALIAHGLYDLVTPYFATRFLMGQLDLPPELSRRLTLAAYEGGHMFYSHRAARAAFTEDARRFYGEMVEPGP